MITWAATGTFARTGRFKGDFSPLRGTMAVLAAIQMTIAICTLRSRSGRVNQLPRKTELAIGMRPQTLPTFHWSQ
jgi:hypothetical protein